MQARLDVIADYGKVASSLLYVDPPYLGSTRQSYGYVREMGTEGEHRELAEALAACRARVVLSGYHSPLYDELYRDWERGDVAALTQGGAARTEVLWTNFTPRPSLFDEATA